GSPPPGRRPRPSHVSGRPPRRDRADPRSARARGRRMRVVIAGAGSVGRSVARELIDKDHSVLLIDQSKEALGHERIPGAEWLLSDACELAGLAEACLEEADVVVAATGDDKTNLVLSLLAKTEFGVPRTVSRVNNPKHEWLFDDNWGVDVAVSTPRLMTSLVEEAVEVGGLVHLMSFERGRAGLLEFTVHETAALVAHRIGTITFPLDTVLVAVIRNSRAFAPSGDDVIEAGDELFFLSSPDQEAALLALLQETAAPGDETDLRAGTAHSSLSSRVCTSSQTGLWATSSPSLPQNRPSRTIRAPGRMPLISRRPRNWARAWPVPSETVMSSRGLSALHDWVRAETTPAMRAVLRASSASTGMTPGIRLARRRSARASASREPKSRTRRVMRSSIPAQRTSVISGPRSKGLSSSSSFFSSSS